MQPIQFCVQGVDIKPSSIVKYLGVWLYTKLMYKVHGDKTVLKAEKNNIISLMPNIGEPGAAKGRILHSVVHSQMRFAVPTWHTVTTNKRVLQNLIRVQRKLCIRICSAYRIISTEAVGGHRRCITNRTADRGKKRKVRRCRTIER